MGVSPRGTFTIDMEKKPVIMISGKTRAVSVKGSLTAWKLLEAQDLTLNSVPQWKLIRMDTFDGYKPPIAKRAVPAAVSAPSPSAPVATGIPSSKPAPPPSPKSANGKKSEDRSGGWLYDDVIKCQGITMLSPKPGHTVGTKYVGLPKHTQVRVTATVHFIDDWQGETAWLKLNDNILFTESHDQKNVAAKFSVCGSDLYPESRFAVPVDVTIKHKDRALTVAFGSNLDEGSDARFAISNVNVYTLNNRIRRLKTKSKKADKKGKKS